MDEADPPPKPKPDKQARLAQALRDNLRRRKAVNPAPGPSAPGGSNGG
jgi:hypothetical protein